MNTDNKVLSVYLAGPINGCSDSEAKDWRKDATDLLAGYEVLDPMRRDYRGKEDDNFQAIVDGDKADIEAADALLVMYPKPSVGTSMEILWAWLDYKPVVLVDASSAPLSPWLRAHVTHITTSLAEACRLISQRSDS